MRQRRLYICFAILLASPFVLWLALRPGTDPVHDKFDLIANGMTRADVEGVMGVQKTIAVGEEDAIILFFHGNDGIGNGFISQETGLVVRKEWVPIDRDPIWLRFWHRLTKAQGL